jgi:uncharacterized protein
MTAVNKIAATKKPASKSRQGRSIAQKTSTAADLKTPSVQSFATAINSGLPDHSELVDLLEEKGPLPNLAEENKLFLFPVDPYLIFSCWTIRQSDAEMGSQKISQKYQRLTPILRFFDITGIVFDGNNAHSHFDIQVDLGAGNCYVPLWRPGRQYIADLGFSNEYGIFYPLCRSRATEMPPGPFADVDSDYHPSEISGSGLSERTDRDFMPGVFSHPSVSAK